MRTWKRATLDLRCGAEPHCAIKTGQAYLELKGESWRKLRCVRHAGEPEPPRIEDDVPRLAPLKPSGFASARELAKVLPMGPKLLKLDPKQRQANDRDD